MDSDSNVVFVRLDNGHSSCEYDTTPAEICFILKTAVRMCRVNSISCFVVRLIVIFSVSWCVKLSTPPHEHGTRDTDLCLGSPLCCRLMHVSGSGIMLGGCRRHLKGIMSEHNLPNPTELFNDE